MAITNAQQYQQLVNKPADGKRPGYRGIGGYQEGKSAPSSKSSSSSKSSGSSGGGGGGRDYSPPSKPTTKTSTPPGINAGAKYKAAALPKSDLTKLLTPLTAFLTKLPRPYICLGCCIRDIAIIFIIKLV